MTCCVQVQQLQGVYNLQEPHFWTLCTDVYIGTLKLLVAPDADSRWILSQTHNIFTQVSELWVTLRPTPEKLEFCSTETSLVSLKKLLTGIGSENYYKQPVHNSVHGIIAHGP
ncbi:hypothetical protein ATANTOWER_010686 [Ataeniobius toweri]|uniref:Zinc transporter n=1 Tax=Ataeniobius toweri TaxID=208326 RepID=A0ABU7AV15_9TELE|nr:hypothetical protein [Ataeniobius toweri]